MLFKQKEIVPPYSRLSEIYDYVMNHVNYRLWAKYISQIIIRYNPNIRWITDISCGTGSLCYELEQMGYQANGCDQSFEMVRQAVIKYKFINKRFWCAEMQNIAFTQKPDMIVSLYDSMNYLSNAAQWQTCFDNVYQSLEENGLFVFDISTLHNSMNVFRNFTQKEKTRNGSYKRSSRFDHKEKIQINYFEIKLNSDPDTLFCETHRQRIRPLAEVLGFVRNSQFTLLGYFNGYSFKTGSENAERVHFVLKK